MKTPSPRLLPALLSIVLLLGLLVGLGCSATKDDPGGGGRDSGGDSFAPDGFGPDGWLEDGTVPPWDVDLTEAGDAAPPGSVLFITPADSAIILAGGKPASMDYFASIQAADGTFTEVTSETTFTLEDATLGSFAGTKLTATKAGKTNVKAKARGLIAATPLLISDPVTIVAPGAPGDAATKFGGGAGGAAPSFVYPTNGTIVPPNMNVLEIHFMPGAGNSLFELSFTGAAVDVKVYLKCDPVGGGCVYTPDATVWKYVAEGGRGKDPVFYKLRAVDGTTPGKVGESATQNISFGLEDMKGGIYYWNAAAGATVRYEFGVSGKTGETYMNGPMAGAAFCVGCHVLSRSGNRIALGLDIPAPSVLKVYEVATRKQLFSAGSMLAGVANFYSFSPDAKTLAISNGSKISLIDGATGAVVKDPFVASGAMPDWSPDGKTFVYAKPGTSVPFGSTGVDSASLELINADGTGGKNLVPFGGKNNFYPAYSPEGGWVVFNRSPSNLNSYDAKDAQVFVVPSAGGTPIFLANASTGGDSWPKWAPFVQKFKAGTLMWVTFSSRRAYGLRSASGKTAQIWMTAIDPAKAKVGIDPSYPGFWLPFQDLSSGNHIAQWVTKVERKPCTGASDCPGEVCRDGVCKPVIK